MPHKFLVQSSGTPPGTGRQGSSVDPREGRVESYRLFGPQEWRVAGRGRGSRARGPGKASSGQGPGGGSSSRRTEGVPAGGTGSVPNGGPRGGVSENPVLGTAQGASAPPLGSSVVHLHCHRDGSGPVREFLRARVGLGVPLEFRGLGLAGVGPPRTSRSSPSVPGKTPEPRGPEPPRCGEGRDGSDPDGARGDGDRGRRGPRRQRQRTMGAPEASVVGEDGGRSVVVSSDHPEIYV